MVWLACCAVGLGDSPAGDWPMWRYDSRRGASSPHELPAQLSLHWTRQLPPAAPAWPREQIKLHYDLQSEPVVAGHRIFVPSNRHDSVTAYDTRTGEELWRFYANGPVRFAPVAYQGKVFFNSDDGYLYSVSAEDGTLIWKLNGGPAERRILGNDRLVSSWPARGGVVLHEDRLFFAASIWPFMGIFIHAVDPETGEILWTNSGDGTNYTIQPHNAPSFAGLVPQGHLAADGDSLVVPGGRSTPGIYDVKTGEQLIFNYDHRAGGHDVGIIGDLIFTAEHAYTRSQGQAVGGGSPAVFDDDVLLASDPASIFGRHSEVSVELAEKRDRKGKLIKEASVKYEERFATKLAAPIPGRWFLKAGNRYFAGGSGRVAAYEVGNSEPVWEAAIEGTVAMMLAADDRLFLVTDDNRLHCFGGADSIRETEVVHHERAVVPLPESDDDWKIRALEILETMKEKRGYALALGIGSGRLIEEVLENSDHHLVVVDPDPNRVRHFRDRLADAGWYGERCAVIHDDPLDANLPPYFANLIISESISLDQSGWKTVFHSLRPYGGTAFLGTGDDQSHQTAIQLCETNMLPQAGLEKQGLFSVLSREGALPETDDWTHQYANASQTVVSGEKLVKAPFGILWFGGPSHEGILPRHGHGPSPQVAGGRLFIEGPDRLRAVDVYTGQLLWERELKGLGAYYDTTAHFPGAGEIGSNYVSLPDRLYAVYGDTILELEAASGETQREFRLPQEAGANGTAPFWGHAVVSDDFLIATSSPIEASGKPSESEETSKNEVPVVPPKADWRYRISDEPVADWQTLDLDDFSDWKTGPAGFGYGDNDDETIVDMRGRASRLLIRHNFDRQAVPEAADGLELKINFDDGFVAYLNGREIVRKNIKRESGGGISVSSHEANGRENFVIKDWRSLLREGNNVIAIEGYNRSASSSDFTLDPVLCATLASEPSPKTEAETDVALPLTRYASGSRHLVVFDRLSGEKLWDREAAFNFRHNNIAASGGVVYCVDRMTDQRAGQLSRRGITLEGQAAMYALDLRTGEVIWEQHEGVFGTFVNYSAEHDILLQGGSAYRDRAKDEVKEGLMAIRGKDGKILWHLPELSYHGPCLLWRDRILTNGTQGFALDLLTGEKTGWSYHRMYGCNTAVGSEHLMTFRSGAAGFFDLAMNSGTGNLGGFKSSCTNNLIPANGVLNAPDYTRTCTCSYQNQTSLALIHMPEAEFWTFGGRANEDRIGINLGAPGDRRSQGGTLFCEYPEVGGDSDGVNLKFRGKDGDKEGEDFRVLRVHASLMSGTDDDRWITASGVEGAEAIEIELPEALAESRIRIQLWFAELDGASPGERMFDVFVDGEPVFKNLDITAEVGERVGLAKEIGPISTTSDALEIELRPTKGSRRPTLISGIELNPVE